jgi:membrane associated rhomboid family serine protease
MNERIPDLYSDPGMMRRPRPWITWMIVGSTVAVFLLQLGGLHLYGEDVVGDTLAFSSGAMAEGRYWTLITYAWVHSVSMFGDSGLFWLHIVANMIPLVCLGPALEEMLGRARYLGLYVGGAIVSALVWHVFNLDTDEPIIGASGAVFAVIAAIGTAAPRERVTVLVFYILPVTLSLRVVAVVACAVEAAQIVLGWMPEVAHSAHLGGAAFGFLYVGALRFLSRRRRLSV